MKRMTRRTQEITHAALSERAQPVAAALGSIARDGGIRVGACGTRRARGTCGTAFAHSYQNKSHISIVYDGNCPYRVRIFCMCVPMHVMTVLEASTS